MFKSAAEIHPASLPESPARRRLLAAAIAGALAHPVAALAQGAAARPLELNANAPERYTVQRGDTLWGIANRVLKEPWRWPELWRFNAEQIRNPHLIYPGQVLALDRLGSRMSVAESRDDRLVPRIRSEAGGRDAIPSIPANAIEPWLARPIVIEEGGLDGAPRIVATEEGRYNLGAGNRAYVRGVAGQAIGTQWQIFRQGRALIDPDSGERLGVEAVYVGIADLMRAEDPARNEPATFVVRRTALEVTTGDRLIPTEAARLVQYAPRAPQSDARARIVGIYGGRGDDGSTFLGRQPGEFRDDAAAYDARREGGTMSVVSLNRGSRDGLEVGHVLALNRRTVLANDRSSGSYYMGGPRLEAVTLPEERYGLVFVFRTFERVSYGLVVQAQRTVVPGDSARRPA